MKNLLNELRMSLAFSAFSLLLLCGLYPLVVFGISQLLFPREAEGSLIRLGGQIVGSDLLGQNFSSPRYFHPRPSAAGRGYDAANSGGSNLGPTSKALVAAVKDRVSAYRAENGLDSGVLIPVDAVTASASGLDPEISLANARLQAARVAKARGIDSAKVAAEVMKHLRGRSLGFLGDPGVNVLRLNLALDGIH